MRFAFIEVLKAWRRIIGRSFGTKELPFLVKSNAASKQERDTNKGSETPTDARFFEAFGVQQEHVGHLFLT